MSDSRRDIKHHRQNKREREVYSDSSSDDHIQDSHHSNLKNRNIQQPTKDSDTGLQRIHTAQDHMSSDDYLASIIECNALSTCDYSAYFFLKQFQNQHPQDNINGISKGSINSHINPSDGPTDGTEGRSVARRPISHRHVPDLLQRAAYHSNGICSGGTSAYRESIDGSGGSTGVGGSMGMGSGVDLPTLSSSKEALRSLYGTLLGSSGAREFYYQGINRDAGVSHAASPKKGHGGLLMEGTHRDSNTISSSNRKSHYATVLDRMLLPALGDTTVSSGGETSSTAAPADFESHLRSLELLSIPLSSFSPPLHSGVSSSQLLLLSPGKGDEEGKGSGGHRYSFSPSTVLTLSAASQLIDLK
eukprot:Tbor_TRINITY_DN2492_c0_g1::TRINITY_DN2492_c0_g1_i1::g.2598::m.2598